MKLLRAGDNTSREMVITRFLDTAKAQQSNLASSVLLTFDYMESVEHRLETDKYARCLHDDIVNSPSLCQSASKLLAFRWRVVWPIYTFYQISKARIPAVLRNLFATLFTSSTQRSVLRQKATCKSLSKMDVLGQWIPRSQVERTSFAPHPLC